MCQQHPAVLLFVSACSKINIQIVYRAVEVLTEAELQHHAVHLCYAADQ